MDKDTSGKHNINIAETINIYYSTGASTARVEKFSNSRTSKEIIRSYMPDNNERKIWRAAVKQNISEHLQKVGRPLSEIQTIHSWLCVDQFNSLDDLSDEHLWIVHEYVTDLDVPWRVKYIGRIEEIREKRGLDFQQFKHIIGARLKMHFVRYDDLTDASLSILYYFVSQFL